MRWLLITNYGNPGDEFARMGVEEIIRVVDPHCSFAFARRDSEPPPGGPAPGKPIQEYQPYDIAVVCSMPGFWSYSKDGTEVSSLTHPSWEIYNRGYLSKKPLVFAGFGTYLSFKKFPRELSIYRRDYVVPEFQRMLKRCAAVYSRDRVGNAVLGVPNHPCPSVFAGINMVHKPELDLCNLMPAGAHYPWIDAREYDKWLDVAQVVARDLQDRGFQFIAHNQFEFDNAMALGWFEKDIIHACNEPWVTVDGADRRTRKLLRVYARARCYVGNRIHGAIVSRSFGARAFCIGYDTRVMSVEDLGGVACTPRTFREQLLHNTIDRSQPEPQISKWFRTQCDIFRNAMKFVV